MIKINYTNDGHGDCIPPVQPLSARMTGATSRGAVLVCIWLFLLALPPLTGSTSVTLADSVNIDTENGGEPKRLSILIVSSFLSGHQIPLLAVGDELVRRGHSVSFFTTEINGSNLIPHLPRQLGMTFLSAGVDPRTKLQYEEAFYACMGRSLVAQVFEFFTLVQDHLLTLRMELDQLNGSKWDIVLADVQTYTLIRYLHLKWGVKIVISVPVAFDYPSMESSWPSPSTFDCSGTEDMSFFHRLLTAVIYRPLLTSSFGIYILKYTLAKKDVELWNVITQDPYFSYAVDILHPVLIYTAYGVEYAKPHLPSVHYVGPVLRRSPLPLGTDLEEWLQDKQKGRVIYISMGTTALLTHSMVNGLIKGIEIANYSVVWSLRETNQYVLKDLDIDRSRLYITSWVSQVAVLQHKAIGVAILHCGTGGVHEALYYKVPIICIPFWYDQFSWANKIRDHSLGLQLEAGKVTPETVLESIREIEGGEYRANAARMSRILKEAGGSKKAAKLVELYAEVGYDHLLPAYARYQWSWIQYYNVDAYALILAVFSAYVYLLWKVVLFVWRWCSRTAKRKVD